MVPESFSQLSPDVPIHRRDMLLKTLRGLTGLALVGCSGDVHRQVMHRQRSAPEHAALQSFAELPEYESIIGTEFSLTANVQGVQQDIRLRMHDAFHWRVNGNDLTIAGIIANKRHTLRDEPVLPMGSNLEECVTDCTVSKAGRGITLHTTLGDAHLTREQLKYLLGTLIDNPTDLENGLYITVDVDIEPNAQARALLNTGNAVSDFTSLFGNSREPITLPDTVQIGFTKPEPIRLAQDTP